MPIINRATWESLEPLLDQVLDLAPEERTRWLADLSSSSPVLAAELSAFLADEAVADQRGFLERMPDISLAGIELGAYRLERPLGQGGMGTVWLARRTDGRFEGVAALKLLNLAVVNPTAQERFRREGSVLARLSHPSIARLLDAGVSDTGQPYLVLEHVDGLPIDEYANNHQLDRAARIQLFLQVLDAVGHAHTNLIVHRDLKPSNILVNADGAVKLLDFGIAKLLDTETGGDRTALTIEGGRVFTPHYAAPEQVRGDSLTTATDVYALGVLLYVLLSGRHPTAEKTRSPAETVQALLEKEPAPLRMGDLDHILAKALAKQPAERYQTVALLAHDLERYLRKEPVTARGHSLAYRLRKFAGRNRAAVIAAVLTAAGLLSATIFSVRQMREAERQRDFAVQQTRIADAQVDFQTALLSQVGERPITMREALDSARAVLERQFAGNPEALTPLLVQLAENYGELGIVDVSLGLLGRAESLAIATRSTDELAMIRCSQSNIYRLDGEYDLAWQVIQSADSLPHSNNPRIRVACLGRRASLGTESDSAEASVGWAQTALGIKDSLGERRDLEYLSVLAVYADALNSVGKSRESVVALMRTLALLDSTGHGSTVNRDMTTHNAAISLSKLGETRTAEIMFQDVLQRATRLDATMIPWQPLIHYAETALYQGAADSAAKYFAVIVRQAVRDTNLYWEGRGLFGLARAKIETGQTREAAQAKTRLESIITAFPHVQDTDDVFPDGATLDGLLALRRGDTVAAQGFFRATLTDHGYFDGKLQRRLAPVALQLAALDLGLNNPKEALTLARGVIEDVSVDSLTLTRSARVGDARLIEGEALLALGDSAEGRTAIAAAAVALRYGAGPDHPRTRHAERLLQ
jgi:serine/threonine-protein kinase